MWKGASLKLVLPALLVELGLTGHGSAGGHVQHTVAHLLTVSHRQLHWRSRSQLLRSITDEVHAK